MNENNHRFLKLFWSYATMIILPVLLSGFITAGMLFKELAVDTKVMNGNIIQQTTDILDSEMNKVLSALVEVDQSDEVRAFINENLQKTGIDRYDAYDTMLELSSIKASSAFCRSAGFYIKDKNVIVTNHSAETLEEFYNSNFDSSNYPFED